MTAKTCRLLPSGLSLTSCAAPPVTTCQAPGAVTVNGKPADQARLEQAYGMAFQQAGLFEWRSVVKNVELPLELLDEVTVRGPHVTDYGFVSGHATVATVVAAVLLLSLGR